ncbi:MAG TPA: aryl-sulfate sulfotransferase [Bryobacteraceae bacterium]|nr:aryl-sulfate sulfotransferase [Bryobacteraceae bacterium]
MTVALHASAAFPLPLGGPVTWTAAASGASAGTLLYRFRVQDPSGAFHTVVDYGPKASLTWTTIGQEGAYQIEVSVFNSNTLEESVTTATTVFSSLVSGAAPVVTPSTNPLVFIYSAPPCPPGERMRVQFQASSGPVQFTPYKACVAGSSMNFYLAGMQPGTQYQIQHTLDSGHFLAAGPVVNFSTSVGATDPLTFTALKYASDPQGLLLQSLLGSPAMATDLQGNLVWLGPSDVTYLTRPVTGGTFLGIGEDPTKDPSQQFLREFDLAGITVAETNAARINQQLASFGVHAITGFHHELRKLPGGGYLALAASERILTDVQGPGTVDVIGDTILVLNSDLQVTWAWDAFDHLDPHRMATLGESCTYPAGVACAPFYLSTFANDWLHGNALQLTPDGNILYSARHQDWLVKIDYANGNGAGDILWRMGAGGDFQIVSSDPNPWFSHQHDPHFEQNDTVLLLFDNGNVRAAANPSAHSRGQALEIDERNRVVRPLLNADLGLYSGALGSAQLLPDGNYHFDAGFLLSVDANGNALDAAQSLEVDASGHIDFGVQFNALEYRTFRMPDLYTAPEDVLRLFGSHATPAKK